MFRLGKTAIGLNRTLINHATMNVNRLMMNPGMIRMMSTRELRVFITNIPWDSTEDDLKEYLEQVGEVKSVRLFRRPDGKLLGSGIAEYGLAEHSQQAIATLHETEFRGRKIYVREDREDAQAKPKRRFDDREGGRGGDRGYGGERGGYREGGERRERRSRDEDAY